MSRDVLLVPVKRWPLARKARLCAGLAAGLITRAEAKAAHGLSDQEIDAWMAACERGGKEALRIGYPRWRKAGASAAKAAE